MYSSIVDELRDNFRAGITIPLHERKKSLQGLIALIEENSDALCDAIYSDLKKSRVESFCFESVFAANEAKDALRRLDNWTKPQSVSRNLLQAIDKAYITKQPLGVVIIIGAWNYPVQLLLCPFVGALAAGNCVILKPSELAPNTANVIEKLVPKYIDQRVVRVIKGGPPETIELLESRFDHIFFTGSISVAKSICVAAAKHLTPVTLELGGKCPAIIDSTSDVALSARRIAWGKFMGCGQTCVAPDYVICDVSIKNEFIEHMIRSIEKLYSENPQKSLDYARIINLKHFDRLTKLMSSGGRMVYGGQQDRNDLYIAPSIMDNVTSTDAIMQEEIFGPILPILTYTNINEAINYVNSQEKPLALYYFSTDKAAIQNILEKTYSGGVTINDVIMHISLETLPFGGVGYSGHGRYHGKYTFDCFTHERSVLQRPQCGEKILWMRYPPYDSSKLLWAKRVLARQSPWSLGCIYILPLFCVGFLLAYFCRSHT